MDAVAKLQHLSLVNKVGAHTKWDVVLQMQMQYYNARNHHWEPLLQARGLKQLPN